MKRKFFLLSCLANRSLTGPGPVVYICRAQNKQYSADVLSVLSVVHTIGYSTICLLLVRYHLRVNTNVTQRQRTLLTAGFVMSTFGPPTKSRPYLVVFITVQNLVGIDALVSNQFNQPIANLYSVVRCERIRGASVQC